MEQIRVTVPNADTDWWNDEAVAGLVGQRPKLLRGEGGGDWSQPVGGATVTAADADDGEIVLTLDVAAHTATTAAAYGQQPYRAGVDYLRLDDNKPQLFSIGLG